MKTDYFQSSIFFLQKCISTVGIVVVRIKHFPARKTTLGKPLFLTAEPLEMTVPLRYVLLLMAGL